MIPWDARLMSFVFKMMSRMNFDELIFFNYRRRLWHCFPRSDERKNIRTELYCSSMYTVQFNVQCALYYVTLKWNRLGLLLTVIRPSLWLFAFLPKQRWIGGKANNMYRSIRELPHRSTVHSYYSCDGQIHVKPGFVVLE